MIYLKIHLRYLKTQKITDQVHFHLIQFKEYFCLKFEIPQLLQRILYISENKTDKDVIRLTLTH